MKIKGKYSAFICFQIITGLILAGIKWISLTVTNTGLCLEFVLKTVLVTQGCFPHPMFPVEFHLQIKNLYEALGYRLQILYGTSVFWDFVLLVVVTFDLPGPQMFALAEKQIRWQIPSASGCSENLQQWVRTAHPWFFWKGPVAQTSCRISCP